MSRYDLADFEWRVIEPLLPNKPQRGRPGAGDRQETGWLYVRPKSMRGRAGTKDSFSGTASN